MKSLLYSYWLFSSVYLVQDSVISFAPQKIIWTTESSYDPSGSTQYWFSPREGLYGVFQSFKSLIISEKRICVVFVSVVIGWKISGKNVQALYHFFSLCQTFYILYFLTNTEKYPIYWGFLDLVADRTGTRLSPFGKERLYGYRSKGYLSVFSSLSLGTLGYYTYRGESQKKSPEGLSDLFE